MVDVAAVVDAFQEMNRVRVTLEIQLSEPGAKSFFQLQATAWSLEAENGGQPPLVLVSVRQELGRRQTMEAAILQLMYALDFQLAEQEWVKNQEAE